VGLEIDFESRYQPFKQPRSAPDWRQLSGTFLKLTTSGRAIPPLCFFNTSLGGCRKKLVRALLTVAAMGSKTLPLQTTP